MVGVRKLELYATRRGTSIMNWSHPGACTGSVYDHWMLSPRCGQRGVANVVVANVVVIKMVVIKVRDIQAVPDACKRRRKAVPEMESSPAAIG